MQPLFFLLSSLLVLNLLALYVFHLQGVNVMPSAVVGQAGAQGIQKTQSKATVETADTSNVPASVQVSNPSSLVDRIRTRYWGCHQPWSRLIGAYLNGHHVTRSR